MKKYDIQAIMAKGKQNTIIVVVHKGISSVDSTTIPRGITVEIRDYDIQEENDRTKKDKFGCLYESSFYSR